MLRLSEAVLAQIAARHGAATLGLFRYWDELGRRRRVSDSLDDLPVLVAAYRKTVAALELIAGDAPAVDEDWDEACVQCQCLIGSARRALGLPAEMGTEAPEQAPLAAMTTAEWLKRSEQGDA